ncbi:RHS repeat-associated core domain-containing protein [Pseudomonas sp. RC10]|uniref:RHS repeat-associated core domain-containing protein n=1 Tax=Pseudomonas bambusae TaxID=3139142 RepID=UPI00313961F9
MNTPIIIGRQTFDGLGRQLTVEVGGHTTRFRYINEQLAPSGNTLADGREIAFTYEKNLNHQLLSVLGQDETPVQMAYQADIGQLASASGERGVQSFAYTPSGQALSDEWVIDDTTHTTHWKYSVAGLLQGFDDAQGIAHRREFDEAGRVQFTRVGSIETRYAYDGLSRLISVEVSDPDTARTLTTSITYDTLGRERTRTFAITPDPDAEDGAPRAVTQTLGYSARDQVISRTWNDGEHVGEETFEYDNRDRLVHYTANAQAAPQDPYGNRIVEQVFTFNALNGYETVLNTFADDTQDEAVFSYADGDPTKVVSVTHTHESWPSSVTLTYDECGRVIGDSLGRSMKWDTQGRLTEVSHEGSTCAYRYDPRGRLVDRQLDDTLTRSFFSADQLTHEQTGEDSLQLIGDDHSLFAVNKVTEGMRKTTLLGTDGQGTVRMEADSAIRTLGYTAHGAQALDAAQVPFGFAGERREPLTGWYIPGGHRPYDPVLMCFLAPDSESPFGAGGINPYAYCAGDPVNRVDPDGHSWVSYALAGAGLALSAIALIPGLQAALPIAGALFSATSTLSTAQIACLAAATLDVVSLTTGVASLALEISGHGGSAAGILGGISLVTGLAGAGIGLKMHSLRNAGAQQRAMDLKTNWSPKPGRLGNSEVIYQGTSRAVDVGFIETYRGTNQAALLTHGDPFRALLMGPDGKVARAADIARDFIAPRLKALNYPADETFVLLSCWGGKNGAALEIAKELGRPVKGFTEKTFVKGFANLQLGGNVANAPLEAVPYLERLRATGNPFKAWKTSFREAGAKIFHPDGTITAAL